MHHTPSSAENSPVSSQHTNSSANKIAFRIFLLTIILAPIAFWPTSYISLDLVKVLVIALGTIGSALFIAHIARKEKKLVLPPRHLWWTGFFLALTVAVSALFSSHISKSFFGRGFEYTTASFILILLLAGLVSYNLIRTNIQRVIMIYVSIVLTYVALILFQLWRLLFNPEFLKFPFLGNGTTTILGNWHSLATYSLLVAIVAITALIFLPLSRRMKVVYWALTIFSFFGACMVYNKNAWLAMVVVLLGLIVQGYFHGFKKSHDLISSFTQRISWIAIIAFIVVSSLFWKGNTLVLPLINYLNVEYSEVGLSMRSTLDIASAVMKEKPVLGSGPNHFSQAYIAHKPTDINLTSAWNAEFVSGYGVIPTFIATQGVLGSLLWLVFLILYIVLALRTFKHLPVDSHQRFVLVSSFGGSIFLWIMMLTSIPSHALIFYTFILTGVSIGSAVFCGILKPKEISLERSQLGIRKYAAVIPVVFMIVGVVWGLIYIKKTVALAFFGSGIRELTVNQDAELAHQAFIRALRIDSSDIYWRAEVEALLFKTATLVREANTKKAPVSEENVLAVTNTIKQALEASRQAIAYDPGNYYNYLSEARVFEVAASLKLDGALENGIQSYLKAITLNPKNPGLYLNLARFQASQNKFEDALISAGAAIKAKGNYLEAIFLVSQIQASSGNLPDAIVAARVATEIDPTSPLLLFQLGFLYYTDKQYGLAAEGLEKALKLQGDYANAQYFLGLAYNYQNRRIDAIAQFEKLKVSNPDNQEVALILNNLKSGRNPFTNAEPPVTSTPEKRSSLPLKDTSN